MSLADSTLEAPSFCFDATLVEYTNPKATYYLIYLPTDIAQQVSFYAGEKKRGWGSVAVRVKVGQSSWNTSIFPDKKQGSYLMLIKAQIRKQEKLQVGEVFECQFKIR